MANLTDVRAIKKTLEYWDSEQAKIDFLNDFAVKISTADLILFGTDENPVFIPDAIKDKIRKAALDAASHEISICMGRMKWMDIPGSPREEN